MKPWLHQQELNKDYSSRHNSTEDLKPTQRPIGSQGMLKAGESLR